MKILDELIEDVYPYETLTKLEEQKLFCNDCYKKHFIKKDGIIYHKRINEINFLVKGIIGELISEYFGLKTAKSKLYKIDNPFKYTTLTEIFTNENVNYSYVNKLFPNYKKSKGLLNFECMNEIKIKGKLLNIDKEYLIKLLKDLKKMTILDYMINNNDRVYINFMFSYMGNKVELKELYDFEMSFLDVTRNYNAFKFNLKKDKDLDYLRNDEDFKEILELAMKLDLNRIFKILDEDYPIILNRDDKLFYENIIKEKQNQIKTYKLIK